jgi:predicted RNA-binding protein
VCFGKVFNIDSDGQREEVMRDVAQMEAHSDGFLLVGSLGEQKFVKCKGKNMDFVDKHSVVLEINIDEV